LVTDVESSGGWDLAQTAAKIRPGLIVLFVSQEMMAQDQVRERVVGRFTPRVLAQMARALARKAQQSQLCN